jgi:hypothetical protein
MEWAKVLIPAVSTLVGAAVVVLGWHRSHRLAAVRDQSNKRRDLRLTMMLDAYRALATSAHRSFVGDTAFEVETALESSQLIGTPTQIGLVHGLLKEFAANQGVDWHPLLTDLRASLREELDLERVQGNLIHLRMAEDRARSDAKPMAKQGAKPDGSSASRLTP